MFFHEKKVAASVSNPFTLVLFFWDNHCMSVCTKGLYEYLPFHHTEYFFKSIQILRDVKQQFVVSSSTFWIGIFLYCVWYWRLWFGASTLIHATGPRVLFYFFKDFIWPSLVWLSGLNVGLCTKRLPVRFPVRAHIWVTGQVPSRGCARGNHTLMFPSLSPSLPLKEGIYNFIYLF